jgi:hypothetical protein
MTYRSKNRTLTEVLIAVTFVCFLMGFVAVLCIGNYYRAKRAMESQKQRRLARLSGHAGNAVVGLADSPKSTISGTSSAQSIEQQNFLGIPTSRHHQNRNNGVPVDLLMH